MASMYECSITGLKEKKVNLTFFRRRGLHFFPFPYQFLQLGLTLRDHPLTRSKEYEDCNA
jgi:hypothetical protein